jgi:hypothetical protein
MTIEAAHDTSPGGRHVRTRNKIGLSPLPRGEGGLRPALSPAGAVRVRGLGLAHPQLDSFPNLAHELLSLPASVC